MPKRLVFLYVHEHNNIKEQGFNLSSDYNISFSALSQAAALPVEGCRISFVKAEKSIPHLYSEGFSDIKAIIGENGAGKSSLLHYIAFAANRHLDHMRYPKEVCNDIAILENRDASGRVNFTIYAGKKWELERQDISLGNIGAGFELISIEEPIWEDLLDFDQSIIYYSNIYDNKFEYGYGELENLSTNFLIRDDLVKHTNELLNKERMSEVVAHALREEMRRLSFGFHFENKLPFTLPAIIRVFFNGGLYQSVKDRATEFSVSENDFEKQLGKAILVWLEDTYIKQPGSTRALFHMEYFAYLIFHQLVHKNTILDGCYPGYVEYRAKAFDLIKDRFHHQFGFMDFSWIISHLTNEEDQLSAGKADLNDSRLSGFFQKFQELDELLVQTNACPMDSLRNSFEIPFDRYGYDVFLRYKETVIITEYLNFSYPGMSSGELGFLTLFSRFYSLVDPLRIGAPQLKQNLLILIDEGDLYFHPKWQVLFLDYLNELLPLIFRDTKIQLILTSHSPFLASDLPEANILRMRKGTDEDKLPISGASAKDKSVIETSSMDTFGANIHELLSDSFFLEGAHIGELAKKTIYKVLDELEGAELARPLGAKAILKIIEQIGKPWVKSRLMEKFEDRFGADQLEDSDD